MITRAELKRQAKESLKGNWGIAIGLMLLYGLIVVALTYTAVGGLFTGVFAAGYIWVTMMLIRGQKPEIKDLFHGTSIFGESFVAGLLLGIFTFLWTLLFFIPGIVKSYSYSMTYFILNDNPGMKANDAITASRKMMNGHKMELFLLDLSFIGWIILTGLTFGILSLYVSPYMQQTRAAFYENLKGEQSPADMIDEETLAA